MKLVSCPEERIDPRVVEMDFLRKILDLRGIKIQESNESSGVLQFMFFVRY
jgi:hypothetical protein